ncbi:MAG: lipopolysaccharide biosynthesis protein [Polyangiaceae bacterium]|nr:lipopolysaccharide biosynthesis protein [Polyangiaceae bacterium]
MSASNPTSESASDAGQATAREAGRGGLAIAVAKVSFILVGFVQQLVFPRILDEAGYGAVSRMLAVVSILNNVIVATSLQGVSRMVAAAQPGAQAATIRATLRVHTVVALVASITFALLAGSIANWVEAPRAATPLRVAAGVVLCYGVYAPLVGSLNGRRRFVDQAGLDIFYGVSRTIAMTTTAYVFARFLGGDGALGAAIGFVASAALIVPIAVTRSGLGSKGPGGPDTREYLTFLLPVFVAQAGINLLLQADLLLLSNAAGKYARLMGLDDKEADKLLGPYRAAQLFGFLPYQLLMSVQFVLFPLLAKAHADGDPAQVRNLTKSGLRTAFVLTGLFAASIASIAPFLLRFAFPEPIAMGAVPFARFYVLGLASLAILGVASSALASLRRERLSMILTWCATGAVVAAILLTRKSDSFGPELLRSTAYATAGAMVVAGVAGCVLLRYAAGAFVSTASLVRVLVAVAVTVTAGSFLPWMGKLLVPVLGVAMAALYMIVLIALGELTKADLAMVRNVLGRGKKPKAA